MIFRLQSGLLLRIPGSQPVTGVFCSDISQQLIDTGLAAGLCVNVLDDDCRIERAVAGLLRQASGFYFGSGWNAVV